MMNCNKKTKQLFPSICALPSLITVSFKNKSNEIKIRTQSGGHSLPLKLLI